MELHGYILLDGFLKPLNNMEYTKESLRETCVLCTSKKQGKRIIGFYRSFGFKMSEHEPTKGTYYATYKNSDSIHIENHKQSWQTVIKLPSTPRKKKLTFPREMWVSDIKECIGMEGKATIIAYCKELEYPWLAKKANAAEGYYIGYKYAKEIKPNPYNDGKNRS